MRTTSHPTANETERKKTMARDKKNTKSSLAASIERRKVPAGIADATLIMKFILRFTNSANRFLATNVREIFATLASADPEGKHLPGTLDRRAVTMLRLLAVTHRLKRMSSISG